MKRILSFLLLLLTSLTQAQKKPLDHTVYDQWQSIKEVALSSDGQWLSYTIVPQEGDGVLYLQHLKHHQKIIIDRGTLAQFTENNNYLIAKIKPSFVETRQAKIAKKKPEEMPKDSLVIINLQSSVIQKIPAVKSFQIAAHNSNVLVYLKDKKTDITKEGSELVIYTLKEHSERILPNVAQFQIHPYGQSVAAYQMKTKTSGSKLIVANTLDTLTKTVSSFFFAAQNINWDEQGKQLAYLVERDSTHKALQKNFSVAYYVDQADSATYILDR